ncbi:hypothetical protein BJ742DRAFT_171766 [Cladochytrium replicatum]|nr:hypothetical protein BJ742DRAFT_171766 [Cladochytrium replicatum]
MIKLAHDPLEKPIESDGHHQQSQFQTTQPSPPALLYHTDLTPHHYITSSAAQSPVQIANHHHHHIPGNYLFVPNMSTLQPAAHQYSTNQFVLLRPQPVLLMNNQSLANTPTVNVTVGSPGIIQQPAFVSPLRMIPSFSGFGSVDEGHQIAFNRLSSHPANSTDWDDRLTPANNALLSPQISSAYSSPMYVFDPGTALNVTGQSQHTFASSEMNEGSQTSMLKLAKSVHMRADHVPAPAMGSNLPGGVFRLNVPQFEIGSPTPGLSQHSPTTMPTIPPYNWPALPASSRKGSISSVSNQSLSSMSPMGIVSTPQEGDPLFSWRPLAAEAAELGELTEDVNPSYITPKSETSREPSVESDFASSTSVSNSSSPPPPSKLAKKRGRKKATSGLTADQQLKRKLRGLRAASKRNSPYYQVDPTTGERIFSCLICSKVYRNQNGLKYHLTHGHIVLDHSRAMEEIAKSGVLAHSRDGGADLDIFSESATSSSSSNSPRIRNIQEMAEKLVERSMADKEAAEMHLEYLKKRGFEHRPFVCEEADCGKRYKNAGGLKYHMEKHHPDKSSRLPVRATTRFEVHGSLDIGEGSLHQTSQSMDGAPPNEDHYTFEYETTATPDGPRLSMVNFPWLPAPEGLEENSQTLPVPPGELEPKVRSHTRKGR